MRIRRHVAAPGCGFTGSFLQRLLVLLIALKLAGVVLVFDPSTAQAFALVKSLWSRAGEWFIAAVLVLALVHYGLAIVPRTVLHLFVAAVAVAALASTVGAANPYLALYGDVERYLGLSFLGDMLVLYLALAIGLRRPRDWASLAAVLAAATVLAAGYALLQFVGKDPIVWNTDVQARPIGSFGNAGPLGEYLAAAFGSAALVGALGRRSGSVRLNVSGWSLAVLFLVAAAIVAARSSILGLIAGVVVVGLCVVRLAAWTRREALMAVVMASAALAIGGAVVSATPLGERVVATVGGAETQDRFVLYRTLLESVGERPVFGWGPGNIEVAYVAHRSADSEAVAHASLHNDAHSWPIQAAVTTGLVGLAALVALIVATIRALWRSFLVVPLASGALLAGGAAFWASALTTVGSPASDWFPWVVFGGAAALEGRVELAGGVAIRPRIALWRSLVAVVIVVALVGAWSGGSALAADRAAFRVQIALARGGTSGLIADGLAAARDDPGRASHWSVLGSAYYRFARYREAGDAFAEAARRAPHEATHLENLAKSRMLQARGGDLTRGGAQAALDAARRAVEVDPNAADPHATLAEVAASLGQAPVALDEIIQAMRLYSRDADYDVIAARAATAVLDRAAARAGLETLLAMRDSATLRIALARVCLLAPDLACARENASRALELNAGNAEAINLLKQAGGP